jgi:hypothetical protein
VFGRTCSARLILGGFRFSLALPGTAFPPADINDPGRGIPNAARRSFRGAFAVEFLFEIPDRPE